MNTKLKEQISEENEKIKEKSYKYKYYWMKLKMFVKESIQKMKLPNILKKNKN